MVYRFKSGWSCDTTSEVVLSKEGVKGRWRFEEVDVDVALYSDCGVRGVCEDFFHFSLEQAGEYRERNPWLFVDADDGM